MKKQLFLYLVFVVSALFLVSVSCSSSEESTSINPDKIVRFLDGEIEIEVSEESDDIIEIPVFSNYDHVAPVEVYYEIIGNAANYELLSTPNKVIIPADERTGSILLKPVGNQTYDNPQNQIVIRITGGNSGFGPPNGVSVGHAEKRITFLDNECPLVLSDFEGAYSADENNGTYGPYDVTITVNAAGDGLVVNNLWDVGGSTSLYLDNSDPLNPKGSFLDGEYLFTSSQYGEASIYNTDYQSTFSVCEQYLDLYFAVCVSLGCYNGFDGATQRVQLTRN